MGSLKHFFVVLSIPFVCAAIDQGLSCTNGDVKRLESDKFLSCVAGTWEQKTYNENDPFPLGENLNRTRRDVKPGDAVEKIGDVSMTNKDGGRSKQKPASRVFPKKCGIMNDEGGSTIEKTPWMVVVVHCSYYLAMCSGTIISQKYVLANAYAFLMRRREEYCIRAWQDRKLEYNITRITLHPDYTSEWPVFDNDIALIEIKGKFKFSDKMQPICMPYHELYKINRQVVLTGVFFPSVQFRLVHNIIGKAECSKLYKGEFNITAGMFCLSNSTNIYTLNRIRNGFLFVNEGVRHYLLGLFLIQVRKGSVNFPIVNIKVVSYMGWIKDVMTGVNSEN